MVYTKSKFSTAEQTRELLKTQSQFKFICKIVPLKLQPAKHPDIIVQVFQSIKRYSRQLLLKDSKSSNRSKKKITKIESAFWDLNWLLWRFGQTLYYLLSVTCIDTANSSEKTRRDILCEDIGNLNNREVKLENIIFFKSNLAASSLVLLEIIDKTSDTAENCSCLSFLV